MAGIRDGFRNPLLTGAEIPDGIISAAALADGSVTTAKLADLAVEAAKLANSSVTATKIANLAVGTAAIANLAVTDAKIDTLSASKITTGTISTGTITVASELRMGSGGKIVFTRGGGASISSNHSPQNGDSWFKWSEISGVGRIQGLVRTGGVELLTGELQSISDGWDFRSGNVGLTGNQRLYGKLNTASAATVTPRFIFDAGDGWGWFATDSMWSLILQRNSDGDNLRIYRSTTLTGSIGTASGTFTLYVGSSTRTLSLLDGGSASSVYIRDGLTDVGNHETLRLDRGTGTLVRPIGYFSSRRDLKREIVPLDRSKLWRSEWFDDLQPVKFRRRSTQGREFGFVLEDLAEIGGGLGRYLTTKGDKVGDSPDEFGLLAVTVLALKEARADVRELQSRVTELEKKPKK